jgi:hypothetical protein
LYVHIRFIIPMPALSLSLADTVVAAHRGTIYRKPLGA